MSDLSLKECCLKVVNESNIELYALDISERLVDGYFVDINEYKNWRSFKASVSSTLTKLHKAGKIQFRILLKNNKNTCIRQKRLFSPIPVQTIPLRHDRTTLKQAIITILRKQSNLGYKDIWAIIRVNDSYQFNCKSTLSEQTSVAGLLSMLEKKGIIESWTNQVMQGIKLFSMKSNYVSPMPKRYLKSKSYTTPKKYVRGYLQELCLNVFELAPNNVLLGPIHVAHKLSTIPGFTNQYKNKRSSIASVGHILKDLSLKGKLKRVKNAKGNGFVYCKPLAPQNNTQQSMDDVKAKRVFFQGKFWDYTPKSKETKDFDPTFLDTKLDELLEQRNQINKDVQAILRVQEITKQTVSILETLKK